LDKAKRGWRIWVW